MTKLSFYERVANYEKTFPRFPKSLIASDTRIDGLWLIGNDYKNKTSYYGSYPNSYLARMSALFPDMDNVLHVFSGSLPKGPYTRVDINPEVCPDYVADATTMPFDNDTFDIAYADPPYSESDADRYGYPMINRKRVIAEVARVLKTGGFLVWLDTQWPMHKKSVVRSVGHIGIVRSTNHRVRVASVFRVV